MKLILIRGLPGSGKTTLAVEMAEMTGAVHLEGDQYFTSGDFYCYRQEWIKDAHQRCRRLASAALDKGRHVIVSNTFTRLWEMNGYFDMALGNLLIDVSVVKCVGEYGSVHNVPEGVFKNMANRWEDYEHESICNS